MFLPRYCLCATAVPRYCSHVDLIHMRAIPWYIGSTTVETRGVAQTGAMKKAQPAKTAPFLLGRNVLPPPTSSSSASAFSTSSGRFGSRCIAVRHSTSGARPLNPGASPGVCSGQTPRTQSKLAPIVDFFPDGPGDCLGLASGFPPVNQSRLAPGG